MTAPKRSVRAVKASAPIYQLRIELLDLEPTIWRRVLVPGSIKLAKLHVVLLWTMGWLGGHLHEFIIGHTHYGEPDPDYPYDPPLRSDARVTLAGALGGLTTFTYLYDFGDGWEHRVRIEQVLPPDSALKHPLCLAGANACPPEDVGGPPGYLDFLEALADPSHEEHDDMLRWCGGAFDSTSFDLDEVNEMLRQIKL